MTIDGLQVFVGFVIFGIIVALCLVGLIELLFPIKKDRADG